MVPTVEQAVRCETNCGFDPFDSDGSNAKKDAPDESLAGAVEASSSASSNRVPSSETCSERRSCRPCPQSQEHGHRRTRCPVHPPDGGMHRTLGNTFPAASSPRTVMYPIAFLFFDSIPPSRHTTFRTLEIPRVRPGGIRFWASRHPASGWWGFIAEGITAVGGPGSPSRLDRAAGATEGGSEDRRAYAKCRAFPGQAREIADRSSGCTADRPRQVGGSRSASRFPTRRQRRSVR